MGDFEHYNHNKRWVSYDQYDPASSLAHTINEELDLTQDELNSSGIASVSKLYPYFSMGYMGYWKMNFIKYPRILILEIKADRILAIGFDSEERRLDLFLCQSTPAYDHLVNMEVSREFQSSDKYLMELLHMDTLMFSTSNPSEMANYCQENIKNQTS